MDNFKLNIDFFETYEFTAVEKRLSLFLEPMITEMTKNFWLKHYNEGHRITTNEIKIYKTKIGSIIELLEPCDNFLKKYSLWVEQRKETIESLRKVETSLKNLVDKYHPLLKIVGPKANFMFSYSLINLLKASGMLTGTEQDGLDLKVEIQENIMKALKMCSLDWKLLHELGIWEYYDQIVNSINNIFGSHEILDDLLKLLKNLPEEVKDSNEAELFICLECTQVQTCLESILPKISKLLADGLPISCTILNIFFSLFMSRRQSCAILMQCQDLGILNKAETEVSKLVAASCVKGSKLEKLIHLEIKKKIDFGTIDDFAINLEIASILLNSIDVNDEFLIPETYLIRELANRFEKDFNSYLKAYEMLEKYSNKRLKRYDINKWTTIIVYHIPTSTDESGIKNFLKPLICKKAQDCIDLERLPTNGNNWLVKVPTYYSQALLKIKYIDIAYERCLIMA